MRIDQYLNAVNIAKNRTIATDMLKSNVVQINHHPIKPSKEVKVGDIITITYIAQTKQYQILDIPKTKTIPKTQKDLFVKELF